MSKIFELKIPTSNISTYYVRGVKTKEDAREMLAAYLNATELSHFPNVSLAGTTETAELHPEYAEIKQVTGRKARSIEAYYFLPDMDYDIEEELDELDAEELALALSNFSCQFSIEVEDIKEDTNEASIELW